MTDEELIRFSNSLSVYELLIYGLLLKYKEENKKCTLEAIHFETIQYILKNRIEISEGSNTIKALKKLATFDKTTQEWSLKSIETILQETKSKRKVCKTPTKEIQNPKNLAQKHS